MSEIVEIAFQYGKCVRCGKEVARDGPGSRWHDEFGRDRCRASLIDDQCDVRKIHDGVRHAKLVETESVTVILGGADGEELLRQTLPQGMGWAESLGEPYEVTWIRVLWEKGQYHAQLTPEELEACTR